MADEADIANDMAEAEREAAVSAIRAKRYHHKGSCWNCSEPILEGAFCPGGECQWDYERIEMNRRVV